MKTINGLPVYEGTDKCSLDEYSSKMATEIPKIIEEASYDDTETRKDISEIQQEQQTQNANIEKLEQEDIDIKEELEKTKKEFNDYAIHGQASGEFIHLTDSAKSSCKIDIKGNVKQDGEPTLDTPAKIQTVKDSVKVTSCNANVLDLTTLTAVNTIECTTENKKENEITLTSTNKTGASYVRFKGKVKAGTWYVKKEFEVLSGTGTNYTGRVFIQDADWNNVLVLNKNLKEGSFTLEEDKELYITLIAKETTDTSTEVIKIRFYNLMISKDDVDFVKHEQNSITVSIQQEMLTNDYLDKTNKKEVHGYKKIILDGTQNFTLLTTTENYLRFILDLSKTSDLKNGFKVYCENLKVVKQSTSTAVNEEKIIERDISLDKQLQIVILKSRLTEPTVEGLKQYLATNNIVAYCVLEEATKLYLTQEQIEAL